MLIIVNTLKFKVFDLLTFLKSIISRKHTSQNAMNMKLGQQVLEVFIDKQPLQNN